MAWLTSSPKEMGETRRGWIARHLGKEKAESFDVEPGPLEWLLDLWGDAGQCRVEYTMDGTHLVGLRWPDIVAWIEGAGEHDLAPIYRRAIIDISTAYAQEAMAARDIGCEAPFDPSKD